MLSANNKKITVANYCIQSGTKTSHQCFCYNCIKYDDFHYSFTR